MDGIWFNVAYWTTSLHACRLASWVFFLLACISACPSIYVCMYVSVYMETWVSRCITCTLYMHWRVHSSSLPLNYMRTLLFNVSSLIHIYISFIRSPLYSMFKLGRISCRWSPYMCTYDFCVNICVLFQFSLHICCSPSVCMCIYSIPLFKSHLCVFAFFDVCNLLCTCNSDLNM